MPSKPVRQLLIAVGVFVVVAAGIAALLLTGRDRGAGPANPGAPPPGTEPGAPAEPDERVVVVKIDNVSLARPQTGLTEADAVFVEPVEGGLTRLAAVYSTRLPPVVGPVRSARETDIDMLAQFGRPTLAFSGAAPEILSLLQESVVDSATAEQIPGAYFREAARPLPHNLYVHPDRLPPGHGRSPASTFGTGPAPEGGRASGEHTVRFPAATYDFHWSAEQGRWLVALDGTPVESVGHGQVGAATVVVQQVPVRAGAHVEDVAGAVSPVAETVGTGAVTVLRDGQEFEGTWSRPVADAPTTFTTAGGEPLRLAEGPVWILLVS
ncbi:DUF3048 domain-containing protein [Saccharomonospora sp. NPDC006951]